MPDATTVELFHNQLSRYCEMAKVEGLGLGSQSRLGAALTFAEDLLLCPTEDAAKVQMLRGPEAARSFLQVALALDGLLSTSDTSILKPPPKNIAPFYLLGSAVQEYLRGSKDQFREDW